MSTLYIAEFQELGYPEPGQAQVAKQPPIAEQTITISGSPATSAAFNTSTRFVRISTDVICSIKFGSVPVPSATTARMAADQVEYFAVLPGHKVAAISNT